MITVDEIKRRIEAGLPGAAVEVATFQGDDHFQARVAAPQFVGKSRVDQHRMVYACLQGLIGGEIHALQLDTRELEN